MPLIRGYHSFDDHFTQIPNAWLRDTRLSFKARGLLALLMSHSPGWNMSIRSIARANGTGVDTVKSAVQELEAAGYLVRSEQQKRTEGGTFADYDWVTCDPSQNPVTVKSRYGETAHKEEQLIKEEHKLRNIDHPAGDPGLEKAWNDFWAVYPRKVGKEAARKAFVKAYKQANGNVVLGAQRFAKDPNLPSTKQFIPHPATWLNQGRWEDEPLPERELTAEEKLEREKLQREERRQADLERSRREREEAERLRAELEANPPARCEHNRIGYACPKCSAAFLAQRGIN